MDDPNSWAASRLLAWRYRPGTAESLLALVVDIATESIPWVDAASVFWQRAAGRHPETLSARSPEVEQVDPVQYRSGSGPSLDTLARREEISTGLPSSRWTDFSSAAESAGFRYVWTGPVGGASVTDAALTLYSRTSEPPVTRYRPQLKALTEEVGVVLANAATVDQLAAENSNLEAALVSRTIIGQAQGILMARQQIGEDEAFDILRRASQRTNRKLREIATEVVNSMREGQSTP